MLVDLIAYGTWGDVRPSLRAGQVLSQAGYDIRLIVTRDFERDARQSGLNYELLPLHEQDVMRQVSSKTNPLLGLLAIRRHIAPALYEAGKWLHANQAGAEVMLVNEWTLAVSAAIASRTNCRLIRLSTKPRLKTSQHPIPTMPTLPGWLPGKERYNRSSYDWARWTRWSTYANVSNTLRQQELDLPSQSFRQYQQLFEQTPSITLVSQHVVPRPSDWAQHHQQTGYLFYDDPVWQPPTKLVNFLEQDDPPIYLGFGSMHDQDPEATTQIIINALERTGQRAVLYHGWAGLGQGQLPDHIFSLDYAPHEWLFPQMIAAVHHAGAGTSAAALRAGLPSVPIPHSGDQPFWARRLHRLGTASKPLARSALSAGALAERIMKVVSDKTITKAAQKLGRQIAAEPSPELTVAAFQQILAQ